MLRVGSFERRPTPAMTFMTTDVNCTIVLGRCRTAKGKCCCGAMTLVEAYVEARIHGGDQEDGGEIRTVKGTNVRREAAKINGWVVGLAI